MREYIENTLTTTLKKRIIDLEKENKVKKTVGFDDLLLLLNLKKELYNEQFNLLREQGFTYKDIFKMDL
ncbi:hypothetical protein D5B42_23145 [Salmonella enterica subsp. enterica serovar Oranienburg]|nr:hypothetical protein [Salmonella enterica subsp. enterica serovar Oranienburg]